MRMLELLKKEQFNKGTHHRPWGAAGPAVADVVDAVAERLRAGGRLVDAGAGTSASLAALDASECEATRGGPEPRASW